MLNYRDDFGKMLALLAILQIFISLSSGAGHGGTVTSTYRGVTVTCPKDSTFKDGYCYRTVSSKATWSEANYACKRMGMYLVRIKDEMDKNFVKTLLPAEKMYWTGFKVANATSMTGMWSGRSEIVNFNSILWNSYQPDTSDDAECGAGMSETGKLSLRNCDKFYGYICQKAALPKDAFHCNSGDGTSAMNVCNKFSDCEDGSDEASCTSSCHHEYEANSGSFNIVYAKQKNCMYSIESDPGTRIKIEIKAIQNIESRADSLKIYTGAKTLNKADILTEVVGDLSSQKVYYSSNNYVVLVFSTDSSDERSPITVTWTTTISEIPTSRSVALTADSTVKQLMSPFFAAGGPVPMYYTQEWVITTSDSKGVITIKFEEIQLKKGSLTVWDGNSLSSKKVFDEIKAVPDAYTYISFHSTVIVRLKTEGDTQSKGFKLSYRQGVDEVMQKASGILQSPGFLYGMYPNSVTAMWTVKRPNDVTTAMSAQIKVFDLYKDSDFLKVYEVVNASYNRPLFQGSGYTGMLEKDSVVFKAESGILKFEFSSSKALTAKGFDIRFSVDCPALNLSKWTNYSGDNYRMFGSQTVLKCSNGYTFMQEEYTNMMNVTMSCKSGGMWDLERHPNCGIRYCGTSPKVNNGFIKSSTGAKFGSQSTYECNGGFTLVGNATINCMGDGNWEAAPKCQSQACTVLPTIMNGEIKNLTNSTDSFADVIEFICDDGYETVGPTKAYCQTFGNWSHAAAKCQKIVCPLQMVKNGNVMSAAGVNYKDSVVIKCNGGYYVNGSMTNITQMEVTCESNKKLSPMVECIDINECKTSTPCNATQDCENNEGSFTCSCKSGYGGDDCTNINECNKTMKMGCSQICNDLDPGYNCSCNSGYELYMYDGFNNINLAVGETGMRMGDKYYINHTCVRKTCALPSHPMNGTRLSRNITFYYEDTVSFRCDPGFINTGGQSRTCMADGSWSNKAPNCTRATCSVPSSIPGPFVNSTPSLTTELYLGDKLMIECMYGTQKLYRTLYCGYKGNDTYTLEGDAAMCPEIDCGTPEAVQGNNFVAAETTLGANFTFTCGDGYKVSGLSMDNDYIVKCKNDREWSFGNLTCIGQKCTDPGTPGGAVQVVTSYELNLMVSFNCTRDGYYPDPPEPFMCGLDNGKAKWNSTTLPLCKDSTKPMFSGCSTTTIKIQNGTAVQFTPPTASDNSGALKSMTVSPDVQPGDIILEDISFTYTAMDYDGNTETCTMSVQVYREEIPSINCPNETYVVEINTTAGFSVSARDLASTSASMSTYDPETVNVNITTVGTLQKITVKADNEAGYSTECSFHVSTEPIACFEENLPKIDNAVKSCDTVNGTLTCSLKCDSRYSYQDGNLTKTYNCIGANKWSPALPPAPCLSFTDPAYKLDFQSDVTISSGLAITCKNEFETEAKKASNLQALSTEVSKKCSDIKEEVDFSLVTEFVDVITDGTKFKVRYTSRFTNSALSDGIKDGCRNIITIAIGLNSLFLRPFTSIECSGTKQINKGTVQLLASGNLCPSGMTKTKLADANEKCVSCPPGTYVSSGNCVKCDADKYQDLSGMTTCKSCPAMTIVNSDQSGCIDTCPKGFISSTSLPPCKACPLDHYWKNATYCEQCPNDGSTVYHVGAESVNECKAKCAAGTFSKTGFEPCMVCPLHHYQESTGMKACVPCACDQITLNNGTSNSSDCKDGAPVVCPVNVTHCNGKGNCYVDNHRKMCNCTKGYTGDNCEKKQDPCDAKPCFNGGTCQPSGDGYTCTCPVKKICDFDAYNKTKGNEEKVNMTTTATLEECKKKCLDSDACVMFTFFSPHCLIYNINTTWSESDDQTLYQKTCSDVQLFNGTQCEFDLLDACTSSSCGEHGMCQDLVPRNEFKCLCPRTGEFTGDKCDLQDYDCTGYCMNGGTCRAFGSTRRQCLCKPGYTGLKCEKNIDDCPLNPVGCMNNGTCKDGVFDYSCQCNGGFSGSNCQMSPDYCQTDGCGNNALCYNDYDRLKSVCTCDKGYKLGNNGKCAMIGVCEGITCKNNGTCVAGKCSCMDGYEGAMCQHNIDDCKDSPCENMGTCEDGLMNYTCKCMTGYTGYNCSIDINDCVGKCGNNSYNCSDQVNDYKCNCKPGWKGKDCLEAIDECMEYPCQHNSTCIDKEADYSCNCTEGWTGKNCDMHVDYCGSTPCQNKGQCFDMINNFFCRCPGGTKGKKCEDFPSVCSIVDACVDSNQCYDSEGTAKCNCTADYTGISCEIIKDRCQDKSLCGKYGECKNKNVGYKCECETAYSGMACGTYSDPCKANPAKCSVSGSKCLSKEEHYLCYCQGGKTLTDKNCKAADEDKDIQFDINVGDEGATLQTPIVMPNKNVLSLFLWARFSMDGVDGETTLVALESREIEEPMASILTDDTPKYFLRLTNKNLTMSNSTDTVSIEIGKNIADKNWYSIGLTWKSSGELSFVVQGSENPVKMTVSGDIPTLFQVVLGRNMNGRISRFKVYNTAVATAEFFKTISASIIEPQGINSADVVQSFTNIKLLKGAKYQYPNKIEKDVCDEGLESASCATKASDTKLPTAKCPEDKMIVETDRIAEVKKFIEEIEGAFGNGNFTIQHTVPKDESYLSGERYSEIAFAIDSKKNFARCLVQLYIKYNNDCPNPKTDATVNYCNGSSGDICSLACPTNQSLSMPSPNMLPCGKLGVYNYMKPAIPYVLPTCGEEGSKKLTVTAKFQYKLQVACADAVKADLHTLLKNDIRSKLNTKKSTWSGLCDDTCSNVQISSKCVGDNLEMTVIFSSTKGMVTRMNFPSTGNTTNYTPKEALMVLICQDKDFDFTAHSNAKVQDDTIAISNVASCESLYALVDDKCVKCGKGTFYNSTSMMCQFCPIGQYQNSTGQTQCLPCGASTTVFEGASSSDDCVEKCVAGNFFNDTAGKCSPCPKNFYQDEEGMAACKKCPKGKITTGPGVKTSTACADDCPPGTERKGTCVPCMVGYYRTLKEDLCVPCDDSDFTTPGNGSQSVSECKIRKCPAGSYRYKNASISNTEECVVCAIGFYQPKPMMEKCIKCDDNFTTENTNSTMSSQCKFYCTEAGKEKVPGKNECSLCPRGKYRVIDASTVFMPCQNCSNGRTTEGKGSTDVSMCSIDICEAGQQLNGTKNCEDCPYDTYQMEAMPTSNDKCKSCQDKHATVKMKATSEYDCKFKCDAGKQLSGANTCEMCPRGTYRNGDRINFFKNCSDCDQEKTTEGEGNMMSSNCSIEICEKGQYLNSTGQCVDCDFDLYQPKNVPKSSDQCKKCDDGFATKTTKATDVSQCEKYCPAGKQYNAATKQCDDCPRGTFRTLSGGRGNLFANCSDCTNGKTTEGVGSTHEDNCSIAICVAGQQLNNAGVCVDCEEDSYQVKDMPTSADKCISCGDKKGTKEKKSNSSALCLDICPAGQEYISAKSKCEPCKKGFWSNGNSTMRFMACEACPVNYTTTGEGSVDPQQNCTILDCDPGSFIDGDQCKLCPIGQYQPLRHQTSCQLCGDNLNTTKPGSISETQCQRYCDVGLEGNATCQYCKPDYYKPSAGRQPCQQCTGNFTSGPKRDTCDKLFCDKGFNISGSACVACPKGTYKDQRGNAVNCLPCDLGTTTPDVATVSKAGCSEKHCVPGKTLKGDKCEPCEKGTYKSDSGNQACTNCSSDKTTQSTGSTSNTDCSVVVCKKGQKRLPSNTCEDCPVGTYQTQSGQSSCDNCGNGNITLKEASTLPSDCVPHCAKGESYNSATKSCVKCALGFYKDVIGNTQSCTKCPTGNTTVSDGSDKRSDCSVADCLAGSYRAVGSTSGCKPCEKNYFQDQNSQTSCKKCSGTKVTFGEGSTKEADCILDCANGKGYNYQTKVCDDCPQNFYTNKSVSEACVKCPSGTNNYKAGSAVCYPCQTDCVVAGSQFIILKLKLVYNIDAVCSDSSTITTVRVQVKTKITSRLKNKPLGYSFCRTSSDCSNIDRLVLTLSGCVINRRRKRATQNTATYDVSVPDVTSDVTNPTTGITEPAASVINRDLSTNPASYSPSSAINLNPVTSTVPTPEVVCTTGQQRLSNNTCATCAAGTYQMSAGCAACPLNNYQDQAGQTTCKKCSDKSSVKIYTMNTQSTAESDCVSICTKDAAYCKNGGKCKEDQSSVTCTCTDRYSGANCEKFIEPESSKMTYVGIGIGCGAALLLLIALSICLCYYGRNRNGNGKKNLMDEEMYTNPLQQYPPQIYDSRSDSRSTYRYAMTNTGFNSGEDIDYDPQSQMYDNFRQQEDMDFFQPRT